MATDSQRKEFSALFSAMLPIDLAARFDALLALSPELWSKIDPWRVWDKPPFGQSHVTELEDPESSPLLHARFDSQVRVLRCGHSKSPGISEEPLRGILDGSSHVLDGFVSIDPGKFGLAINHDGGLCILRRP